MGTRSSIGIWNNDGSVKMIYCHWDGYPDHVGAVLLEHYTDETKVRQLLNLGDISSLGKDVSPPPGCSDHSHNNPVQGVTVSYYRDRAARTELGYRDQWQDVKPDEFLSLEAAQRSLNKSDREWFYLFNVNHNEWYYSNLNSSWPDKMYKLGRKRCKLPPVMGLPEKTTSKALEFWPITKSFLKAYVPPRTPLLRVPADVAMSGAKPKKPTPERVTNSVIIADLAAQLNDLRNTVENKINTIIATLLRLKP